MGSKRARPMTAQETWRSGQEPARSEFETQHWLLAAACPEVHHFSVPNGIITYTAGRGRKPRLVLDTERDTEKELVLDTEGLLPFCLWPF